MRSSGAARRGEGKRRIRTEREAWNEGEQGHRMRADGDRGEETDPHKGKLRISSLCKTSCVLKSIFGSAFSLYVYTGRLRSNLNFFAPQHR